MVLGTGKDSLESGKALVQKIIILKQSNEIYHLMYFMYSLETENVTNKVYISSPLQW